MNLDVRTCLKLQFLSSRISLKFSWSEIVLSGLQVIIVWSKFISLTGLNIFDDLSRFWCYRFRANQAGDKVMLSVTSGTLRRRMGWWPLPFLVNLFFLASCVSDAWWLEKGFSVPTGNTSVSVPSFLSLSYYSWTTTLKHYLQVLQYWFY